MANKLYIPGVPQKVERQIFSNLRSTCKSVIFFFTSLNKASSAEENNTKIIEFGWVILILCLISWNTVIFKFCLIFATDEWRFVSGMAFHKVFGGKPIDPCQQKNVNGKQPYVTSFRSMGFTKNTLWKAFPDTILRSSQKSSEIWKWLYMYFKIWA